MVVPNKCRNHLPIRKLLLLASIFLLGYGANQQVDSRCIGQRRIYLKDWKRNHSCKRNEHGKCKENRKTGKVRKKKKRRWFYTDPIYGLIDLSKFDWVVRKLIQTPHFERLSRVKQNGMCAFVQGLAHTRGEHSIGVCWLAKRQVDYLWEKDQQNPEHQRLHKDHKWKEFSKLVQIAALFHDAGHGPFSHVFEQTMENWEHENMSVKMLKHALNTFDHDLTSQQIESIQHMIEGKEPSHDKWLWSIVSNPSGGPDCDRLDYLIRDSFHAGHPTPLKFTEVDNLLKSVSIDNGELCYPQEQLEFLDYLQIFRKDMHENYYQTEEVKAAECMLLRVFSLIGGFMNFQKRVDSCELFCKFNDSILDEIAKHAEDDLTSANKNKLIAAKKLIQRLRARDLYKCLHKQMSTSETPQPLEVPECVKICTAFCSTGKAGGIVYLLTRDREKYAQRLSHSVRITNYYIFCDDLGSRANWKKQQFMRRIRPNRVKR